MTCAAVNLVGKCPELNERLAKWAISSEKTELHDLIMEVGIKSMLDDLHGRPESKLETSDGDTQGSGSKRGPAWGGLENGEAK